MTPGGSRVGGTRFRAVAVVLVAALAVTGGFVTATGTDVLSFGSAGQDADAPGEFPPGTSPDGVENASRLVERHRAVLAAAGTFRVENGINASRPAGTPRPARWKWNQTVTHRFGVGATPAFVSNRTVEMPGMRKRMQYHATPTAWHTRIRAGDGEWRTSAQSRNLTATAFRAWALDHSLASSLSRFEFAYAGRFERDNRTLYRFTSTAYRGERERSERYLPNTVTNASATLLVDDRGLIVRLATSYDGTSVAETDAGERLTVPVNARYWWSFEPRPGQAVRRPAWVADAAA